MSVTERSGKSEAPEKFDVGGVLLDRPFKIRRLGHFGLSLTDVEGSLPFYRDDLGFRVSDSLDFSKILPPPVVKDLPETTAWFLRHGGDHHAFVIFPKQLMDFLSGGNLPAGVDINQITWQVGSLAEVVNGQEWLSSRGFFLQRSGRDMPGSNWHTYFVDPEGHVNELYYGIEQVGWDGLSKPRAMHARGFFETPELPQISEHQEVAQALAQGVEIDSGSRETERLPFDYEVDGIMLPRPFKVTKIGPVSLFVHDPDAMAGFYRDGLGLDLTESVTWQGHECHFLRANTEHHSLALYPHALQEVLGLGDHSTNMAFGCQVATYRQLRDAVRFLQERGAEVLDVPSDLVPGIDYVAHVRAPEGHVIQLYYYMEQIGWDGRPRPRDGARPGGLADWPETVERQPDVYNGEIFLGPWA